MQTPRAGTGCTSEHSRYVAATKGIEQAQLGCSKQDLIITGTADAGILQWAT